MQLHISVNKSLGSGANIFILVDKIHAFEWKINLWMNKIENENYLVFQTFYSLVNDDNMLKLE